MKLLITGSHGFIARNFISHLKEKENIDIITFDSTDTIDKIKNNINNIDFIFHLAGVNRTSNNEDFYKGNYELTKSIVDIVKKVNPEIPFVYSSSIQAQLDNDYGRSKKQAEDYILESLSNAYVFRLHNVFGKWCKPNYNSVIATFCYNISHNIDIHVDDVNKELELIYIDDICDTFLKLIDGIDCSECENSYHYIMPRYKKTLGYIANKINEFKNTTNSIFVPNTGDEFVKKLYATYISYVPVNELIYNAKQNVDERGSFTELVRTLDSGQFSVSISKKGITRGNHYHHTKMERFIVIKGKAKISLEHIETNEHYDFVVDDKDVKIVTIPVGYTHNITNIGEDEMVLVMWCNELFDSEKPDTYYKELKLK